MKSNIVNGILVAFLIGGVVLFALALYDVLGMFGIGADGS